MNRVIIMVLFCITTVFLGACRMHEHARTRYVFTYLKTGPSSSGHTPERKQEIFKQHMANIQRLAEKRQLLIAGPFAKPSDSTWRGIFVFDVPTVAEAQSLVATDEGVAAGEFSVECVEMSTTPRLRQYFDIYKAESAKRSTGSQEPSQPAIRAYVMVTADNFAQVRDRVSRSDLADRVVWWGKFSGSKSGGVCVIDAKTTDIVQRSLGDGGWSIDVWWSDSLLTMIPRVPMDY